ADRLFPAFRVGDGANLGDGALPTLQFPLRDSVHPAEKRILLRSLLPRLKFLPSLKGSLGSILCRPLGRKRTGAEESNTEESNGCKFQVDNQLMNSPTYAFSWLSLRSVVSPIT